MSDTGELRIGVDIGGTFTDIVLFSPDGVVTRKVSTSSGEYSRAVVEAVSALLSGLNLAPDRVREVIHGTTVATNTILELKGARTGLITTEGFRDVLELRRIRGPELYNLFYQKPPPLVPRRHRLEVPGRIDRSGAEVRPLDLEAAERALKRLVAEGVQTLAICLINSYASAAHERAIAELAAERFPHLDISVSSEVLPEIREYERTSTTVINAYLRPVVSGYLTGLERGLNEQGINGPLLIMQSNGGIMSAEAASRRPVHIVESGPAAGVIASAVLARRLGMENVLTFDMGGTTAKTSIIERGRVSQTPEYEVGGGMSLTSRLIKGGGYALRVPVIDIAEVGAGGGSIAWIDRGGSLQIGPRSAGADPGPVCYGRGGSEPTVSDANLALGYLNPDFLVGGELPLDAAEARRALSERVAGPLGLSLEQAAYGVHLVANASMMRAVRSVSTQRGRDPRGYALFAFGGNGPVHAVELARALGIARVVVPPSPGLFSAFGLLYADLEHHYVRTIFRPTRDLDLAELNRALGELEREGRATLLAEGYSPERSVLEWQADLRYAGQSFELTVGLEAPPLGAAALEQLREAFAVEHKRTYGHRLGAEAKIDLVNLRLVASGISDRPRAPSAVGPAQAHAVASAARPDRAAYFGAHVGSVQTPILERYDLSGDAQAGPIIVEEYDATTVVPPGCTVRLDDCENIIIEMGSEAA